MLKLDITNKSYDDFPFIRDLSLEIKGGEFICLRGKSGSGKSTLINIFNLLDNDYEGSYFYNDVDLKNLSSSKKAEFRKNHFGIIFQEFNLITKMNVAENIMFALNLIGYTNDKDARVRQLLDLVGLSGYEQAKINELSGGQQQKIAIARALACDPDIIFADEPTGNLDPKSTVEIIKLLETLNKMGKTIVLITHDETVSQYAKRVVTIFRGKIEQDHKKIKTEYKDYDFKPKSSFDTKNLFSLALTNLIKHKYRYIITNIILVAAMIMAAVYLFGINSYNNVAVNDLNRNNYQIQLMRNYDDNSPEYQEKYDSAVEQVASLFENSTVTVENYANSNVLRVNGIDFSDLNYVYLFFKPFESDTRSYYLETGKDPVNDMEIVIDELFIKTFLNADYDIKNSDPSDYINKDILLVLDNNGEEVSYTFKITGVDNSYSQDFEKGVSPTIFLSSKTLELIKDSLVYSQLTTIYVPGNLYDKNEIETILTENNFEAGHDGDADHAQTSTTSQVNEYEIQAPTGFMNNFATQFIITSSLFIIIISLISGVTLMGVISMREKELGIYYALGLNQIDIFKTLSIEFFLNSLIISVIITILINLYVRYLYASEIFLLPAKVFHLYDYGLLFLLGLFISFITILISYLKIRSQDPIKIIRK